LAGLLIKAGREPVGSLSSIGVAKDDSLLKQQETRFYPANRLQPLPAHVAFHIDFKRRHPCPMPLAFRLHVFAHQDEFVAAQMVNPAETPPRGASVECTPLGVPRPSKACLFRAAVPWKLGDNQFSR